MDGGSLKLRKSAYLHLKNKNTLVIDFLNPNKFGRIRGFKFDIKPFSERNIGLEKDCLIKFILPFYQATISLSVRHFMRSFFARHPPAINLAMTGICLPFSVRAPHPTWGKFLHPCTWLAEEG
ncbi:hypothetical protein [Methyloglobulus sp.]|uniref:hypothetical protein n=1 Tax=Methyloglobulus sp. TaxID=2518622 RepID=UPI0039897D3A